MTDQELIAYLKLQGLDKDVAAADRIEELMKERDDYKDLYYAAFKDAASLNIHYAEIGYKAKTAEAKLTKAVEALCEILHKSRSADATYVKLFSEVVSEIRAVLAELEGK